MIVFQIFSTSRFLRHEGQPSWEESVSAVVRRVGWASSCNHLLWTSCVVHWQIEERWAVRSRYWIALSFVPITSYYVIKYHSSSNKIKKQVHPAEVADRHRCRSWWTGEELSVTGVGPTIPEELYNCLRQVLKINCSFFRVLFKTGKPGTMISEANLSMQFCRRTVLRQLCILFR